MIHRPCHIQAQERQSTRYRQYPPPSGTVEGSRHSWCRMAYCNVCLCLHNWLYSRWLTQRRNSTVLQREGSRHDCSNYHCITLLSVPDKEFAHVLLSRAHERLRSCRRIQQSGFTPRRTTIDHIITPASSPNPAWILSFITDCLCWPEGSVRQC